MHLSSETGRPVRIALATAVAVALSLAAVATASADGEARLIRVDDRAGCPANGTMVRDRANNLGVVTGVSNGMCAFRMQDGTNRYALSWQLTVTSGQQAAAAAAPGAGSLTPGNYVCSMSSAGGQFPIVIKDGKRYVDRAGKQGNYSISGKVITFSSGSLQGQYSEIRSPTKFGLSTRYNGMFYGICNLKK